MTTPIGPYAPIVSAGPWLICSGQLGLADAPPDEPGPPTLVEGGPVTELGQALAKAACLLEEHGATPADVVKTTIYVTDLSGFDQLNQVYAAFFADHRPARSVVAVAGLPLGAAVEVEVWAYRDR